MAFWGDWWWREEADEDEDDDEKQEEEEEDGNQSPQSLPKTIPSEKMLQANAEAAISSVEG